MLFLSFSCFPLLFLPFVYFKCKNIIFFRETGCPVCFLLTFCYFILTTQYSILLLVLFDLTPYFCKILPNHSLSFQKLAICCFSESPPGFPLVTAILSLLFPLPNGNTCKTAALLREPAQTPGCFLSWSFHHFGWTSTVRHGPARIWPVHKVIHNLSDA